MSGRGNYEQVSLSATRPISSVSDISQPEHHGSRSFERDSISPIPSPSGSRYDSPKHGSNEKPDPRISLRSVSSSRTATSSADAKWLPVTLRWYLVWLPTAMAMISGVAIMLLYWHSHRNNGLGPAISAIFGWKFAPTLIAVIYTQLTTILFDDVKRTEPFARLARPAGRVPITARTILETPKAWWVTLVLGFQKKHNGGQRSWVLIMACLINVLAFLAISPLSSALLGVDDMRISRPVEMTRMMPKQDSVLKPFEDRDMFFRTTAALLQNVTTSPWISNDYSVLPFWPVETTGSPWNAQALQSPRTWRAETAVFRAGFTCAKMELAKTALFNKTLPDDKTPTLMASVRLDSSDGCQYNMTSSADDAYDPGWFFSWADAAHIADQDNYRGELLDEEIPATSNDKCHGDEAIIVGNTWLDYDPMKSNKTKFLSNMTTWGYMCSSTLSMATLPVIASVSDTSFDINFDEADFTRLQKPVPESLLKHSDLLPIFTNPEWYQYVPTPNLITKSSEFSGISALLATHYGLNADLMAKAADLPEQAARIRRRHFGELLRSSLDAVGASQMDRIWAEEAVVERRVNVSMEAAALLAGLFFVSSLMLLYVTWFSRITQRPLNLVHDPATVLGTTSLIARSADVLTSLRGLDQASTQELRDGLRNHVYYTSAGHLHQEFAHGQPAVADPAPKTAVKTAQKSPFFLKLWALLGLLIYLILLLAALVVVHQFATKSSLRQALFTYRVNSKTFGSFAPFSIIPTTLGIAVGLWWNGMDRSFRSLQPYVTMSKAPVKMARGAGVSYQSTHWLLASFRAAKNKHWLLSLVTLGTFFAQALIISMSALFEFNTGLVDSQVTLNRTLELRQTPHLRLERETYPPNFDSSRSAYGFPYVSATLQELYTNLTTNWMYSAVIQTTLNGSEPPWSKDGWSFVPVDLSHLKDVQETYHNNDSETDAMFTLYSPINVTMTTPAIKARLECSPTDDVSNTTWWLSPYNYTDPETNKTISMNNVKYYWNVDLPTFNYTTPLAPDSQYVQCCFNQTEPARVKDWTMPLAVGYWTTNYGLRSDEKSVTGDNGNFTVKWIHGEGGFPQYTGGSRPQIMWPTAPKLQSLNCMPIMETSEANIIVDKHTGRVQSYEILADPVTDQSAWSDSFVFHEVNDPKDPAFQAQLNAPKSEFADDDDPIYARQNMTASYGVLFTQALVHASRIRSLGAPMAGRGSMIVEDLTDNVFNIRNNETGLNLDFMSYASYIRAGKDGQALADQSTLIRHTQETFATFFQHYVSSNYSFMDGGWAYQPVGGNLNDLGAVVNGTFRQIAPGGKPAVKFRDLPPQNTERTATATMSTRVEVLDMNRNAFWLCFAILIWLIITVLIVCALHKWDFGKLGHDIESIADTLVLVAGSERLLAAVREHGVQGLMGSNVRTRLGWFSDKDGRMRRGIEVVEEGEVLVQ